MSAQQVEEQYDEVAGRGPSTVGPVGTVTAPETPGPVEVRRSAVVGALVGGAAAAVGIGWLGRAAGSGAALDWAVCVLMGVVALVFLRSLFDARTPLLVVDELGVRMRLANHWRGLPWEAVDTVTVQPRRGLLRDGRVVVGLHDEQRAVEGLDGRARRQAALNRRRYGATLAVPLGLATRVVGARAEEVADRVTALSEGRADVVTLVPPRAAAEPTAPAVEPPLVTGRAAPDDQVADDIEPVEPPLVTGRAAAGDSALRRVRWLRRSDRPATEDPDAEPLDDAPSLAADPAPGTGATALAAEPDLDPATGPGTDPDAAASSPVALRRIGRVTGAVTTAVTDKVTDAMTKAVAPVHDRSGSPGADGTVRAIARLGDPVAPLVIDDFRPDPAYDPVIGPELSAARTRVGLSVDELADRTRIRPHVIESIEVDDFGACGGDFYARGHIRTLARVLGKDPVPLLERFEERYASAPVNARTVFEAELSTGMVGSMRRTSGGPNWALLVSAVIALVLVWSLVRVFAGSGTEVLEDPPPMFDGSAGIGTGVGAGIEPRAVERRDERDERGAAPAPAPVATTISAVGGETDVVVRDGRGEVVLRSALTVGEVQQLEVQPPVTVVAGNGSVVSVSIEGRDLGVLGQAQERATRTFQRPSR